MPITIKGFEILEQLYSSNFSTIYRAIQIPENKPVVVKYLNKEFPTSEDLSKFSREFRITRNLYGEGIIESYALIKHQNSLVMINEDFGGESLAKLLPEKHPYLDQKIAIAIYIAEALGQIHNQSIIHKDINPSNIIWNPRTNRVKITDFGISTELSRENPEIRHPNVLEGTIAYVSPEQTGRMNRSTDYRTDLYSLGVTFYEMFTGELPFYASDAMSMVHCHIAIMPTPPHLVNPQIPQALSGIIMKLLAKTPEERYQSSFGLKRDLEFCLEGITTGMPMDQFKPGRYDMSGYFHIPQKLYGRKEELETLIEAFDRVSAGSKEFMLVAGYSGIGKSALVHEVNKPIVGRRGNFISGKFDQFKRNVPYSALIQAFQELVRTLLAEREDRLAVWKNKLVEALGPSGRIVIDVIPEVELIIGKQPPVQELDPDQTRNRFHIVFQNFIRVFAAKDHPLTLFIDDLQWADLPSLHLIEQFMSDPATSYLLIIGSYRDNEVDDTHPLMTVTDTMKKNGITINTIRLKPLNPLQVNHLVTDVLNSDYERAYPLSRLCYEKTLGNPFFLYQLLYSLYEDNSLVFNANEGIWDFDIDQIRNASIMENVIDLMVNKIKKLEPAVQAVLKLASSIGNHFDLDTLSMVSEMPRASVAGLLFETLKERLIIPVDETYKLISENDDQLNVGYRFLHDRILHAAYSLIPDMEKRQIHLKIGRLLLKNTSVEERGEKLFDIANHLNHGSNLITEPSEKEQLAGINLLAGQKARLSAAYKPSFTYLKFGISLSGDHGWETSYARMLSLHTEAMESAYLNMDYSEVHRLYAAVDQCARSTPDKVKACDIKILALLSESHFRQAMDAGLDLLRDLNVKLPRKPKKWHTLIGLLKLKLLLAHKTDDMIMAAKPMTDPLALARASILHKLASTSLFSRPELYPLIIFKRIELTLKFGEDPLYSFSSIGSLGLIFCSIGNIGEGYRFGRLSEKLLYRSSIKKEMTRVMLLMNMFIRHWKDHLRDTLKPLLNAYESRLETGDIEYASHAISAYCMQIFICGIKLKRVDKEQKGFINSIRLLRQKSDVDNIANLHQTTLNLMDANKPLTEYSGTSFNETDMLPVLVSEGNKIALFIYHLYKMYLYYLAGEYNLAYTRIDQAASYLMSVRALAVVSLFNLYSSLTRLALYPDAPQKDRKKIMKDVETDQRQMKSWSEHAPMNFTHKWHLVEAEKGRVLNRPEAAKTHYKLAIQGAKEHDYIQEEALANERYALFLLDQGENDFAAVTMKKAHYCYELWGAEAKTAHLEKTYPILLKETESGTQPRKQKSRTNDFFTTGTKKTESEILDMASLMKASRMISREIVLSKLIEKMLSITMENVGAEKGFVILEKEGRYIIEGEGTIGRDDFKVLQSVPVDNHPGISSAIVNYVARTKQVLILDDAAKEGIFTDDPYVIKNKPRSILCTAIMNQGKTVAIMYMENNLSKAAFRLERMEILNSLASQAAISIDNARLYEHLEEKVKERTDALNSTLKQVENANEKIMSGIRYSGIIQNSLLPDPAVVSSFLPDSFFLWKPRDIVGGDIYVCEKLENGIIIAIIDCTGHGVPGAFMTMLASSGLRRIIREDGLHEPAEILKRLNYIIKSSLQQDTEHARSDDGLDAGVCYFNTEEKILYFSSARIPLYYVDNGTLHTVKGDKHSIGYVSSILDYPFKTVRIENKDLTKTFYMATDGYSDQLGGEDKSRFMTKNLTDLLLRNHMLSFDRQSFALIQALENHRGDNERTDDVTVSGFKFR